MAVTSSSTSRSLARPARFAVVAVMAVALAVVLATAASAHVTVRADTTEPGGFAKYTIRVPNESDTAATTSIEMQFPEGFEAGLVEPVAGWDIAIADGVLTIDGGSIAPGEFVEFAFTARNPEEATTLAFPTIQLYDDGEEAAWVGEPDSDRPAPRVELVAAASTATEAAEPTDDVAPSDDTVATVPAAPTSDTATEAATPAATEPAATDSEAAATEAPAIDPATDAVAADATTSSDDDGGNGLAVAALVVGLAALAVAGAALVTARRSA